MRGGTSSWHPEIKDLCSDRNLENLLEVNTQTQSLGAQSPGTQEEAGVLNAGERGACGASGERGCGEGLGGGAEWPAHILRSGHWVVITLCRVTKPPPSSRTLRKVDTGYQHRAVVCVPVCVWSGTEEDTAGGAAARLTQQRQES